MSSGRVAVVGGSGFVGSAVVAALLARGFEPIPVRAPRLPRLQADLALNFVAANRETVSELARRLEGCCAVVNAAGLATADSGDEGELMAANGVLPGIVAAAAREAATERYVHVSSAAVQGRRALLDDSNELAPFSSYSRSKVLGERLARSFFGGSVVVYRPPSVHGVARSQTRSVARFAGSPFASVARPGSAPSPQALIGDVGDAVAFLATTPQHPPCTVIHPWGGLSVTGLMESLGGRSPLQLPRVPARVLVSTLFFLGHRSAMVTANARRVELLWFGQRQERSWLSQAGWVAPAGPDAWVELGKQVRASQESSNARN